MLRAAAAAAALAVALAGADEYPLKKGVHRITSFDGTGLNAISFVPDVASPPAGGFPVIVFINSWGVGSWEYVFPTEYLAKGGYVGVEYEARGFYLSGGTIGTASPLDVRDVSSVIDWTLAHFSALVAGNATKIGLGGISYGGGISLLAGGTDPRVTAVASMSGWKSLIDALWWQQAPSLFWGNFLIVAGEATGRLPDEVKQIFSDLMTYTNISYAISWGALRSPDRVLAQLNAAKMPILMVNNLEDNLFHANFQLDFWQQFEGPKKLISCQGTHAQCEAEGLRPDDPSQHVWVAADAWFNRFLKGAQNHIDASPLVSISMGDREDSTYYVNVDDWPPVDPVYGYAVKSFTATAPAGNATMGELHSGGPPVPASAASLAYSNDTKMSGGIPIFSPVLKPFIPILAPLRRLVPGREFVLASGRMNDTFRLCGNAEVDGLDIVANADRFQVMMYLYTYNEFSALPEDAKLVSHTPSGVWANATAGQPFRMPRFEFRTACVDVVPGRRLALGFNLFNALYEPANNSSDLRVEFRFGSDFVLNVPTVSAST